VYVLRCFFEGGVYLTIRPRASRTLAT
jgi:hypothetical protein